MSDVEVAEIDMRWKDWLPSCLYGFLIVVQFALAYFYYNNLQLDIIANTGWLFFMVSAVFGWLPIYILKKKGGVPEKKSYIHTTVLVDSGIYSVVRHPQYLAGVLMSLALALITQYWISAILFIPVSVGFYWDSLRADKILVEKFGREYEVYMESVSGMNPMRGILRRIRNKGEGAFGDAV